MNILFETGIFFNSKNSKGFKEVQVFYKSSVLLGRAQTRKLLSGKQQLFAKSFFTGSEGAHLPSQHVGDRDRRRIRSSRSS